MVRHAPLGELLVQAGALSPVALQEALERQRAGSGRIGETLVQHRLADAEAVARALAQQVALPYAPAPLAPDPAAARLVQPELARTLALVPLALEGRALRVAMSDPLDHDAVVQVGFHCGRRVVPAVASARAIERAHLLAYGGELSELVRDLPSVRPEEDRSARVLEREASSAPVVRLVDLLLRRAVEDGASDIHLEGAGSELKVRLRVDGVLRTLIELPLVGRDAVVSRLKIMAGLDIAERRRPQDGGFQIEQAGGMLTVRASTLPVEGGEKVVLRLLDPLHAPAGLDLLGLAHDDLRRLRRALGANQGLLLVAGPTGSGKSTTLQAALMELDRARRNVVTLEDPIEYRLDGAHQVQVRRAAGLTFPSVLRAVLRQDPDVIMVGEVRDGETAEIAISAAVTGHLVLSTVHTVDAAGALTRLMNMGVPAYLVAAGVTAVVAQRLVRTVCPRCRGRASGCDACPDGYRGRTGIFQVLTVNDAVRDRLLRGASTAELRRLARRAGTRSLVEDAQRKVAEGVTTPHEVARVLQADAGSLLPCRACGGDVPDESVGCPHCGAEVERRCACGSALLAEWRFCPACRRKA